MKTANLLSISGGKDSTALILYAKEKGIDCKYVFADTGNEHSETYKYLDYLESSLKISIERVKPDFTELIEKKKKTVVEKWTKEGIDKKYIDSAIENLKPSGNPFLDLCIATGRFPNAMARFCTTELKVFPIQEKLIFPLLKKHGKVRSWQGIRAEESFKRSKMTIHEKLDGNIWAYRPLLNWSANDVFNIHFKHNIKPNPLYSKGMKRVGCMPCIMVTKDEIAEISKRFPEVIDRLRAWEDTVSKVCKKGNATIFKYKGKDPLLDYKKHGIDSAVDWAMTTRGGKQYDLFKKLEDVPQCSSFYGLCETK